MRRALREILQTLLLALVIFLGVRAAVQNYEVDGHSMEPSLKNGLVVLVNKVVYRLHPPRRGDIIVFRSPDGQRFLIKRVIGLPGETVEIREGHTYVNGEAVAEPYVNVRPSDSLLPRRVPEGYYFVMGDNRPSSTDSRQWGPVARGSIAGRAWVILWPVSEWGGAPNYAVAAGAQP